MLVEHARNVMGISDATHGESGTRGTTIITPLSCSLLESTIDVEIATGSRLAEVYGSRRATERAHCSYGLEPAFAHIASSRGMTVSAVDGTGEPRAVERRSHPFFHATLYQPQRSSTPERPHPIWIAFVRAAVARDLTVRS